LLGANDVRQMIRNKKTYTRRGKKNLKIQQTGIINVSATNLYVSGCEISTN